MSRSAVSAGVVSGLLVLLLAGAVAGAVPALAVDDPTRPDARVTHGPSCRPGGIVVEVVAGTVPYTVRLATTRRPGGEDEAALVAGASVVLRTADVAPGETIDPRLEFTAGDGSATTHVDELDDFTLTRPTVEDCQAALDPPPPPPAPPTAEVEAVGASPAGTGAPAGTNVQPDTPQTAATAPGATPATSGSGATTAASTAGSPARTSVPAGPLAAGAGASHSASWAEPGGTVTLRGAGFLPGERVEVVLHGRDGVLATAIADAQGSVRVDVRLPPEAPVGQATLDLVGTDSAVSAAVGLRVAAATEPAGSAGDLVPLASLVAAATALVGTVAGLVSVAGQRHAHRRARGPVPAA